MQLIEAVAKAIGRMIRYVGVVSAAIVSFEHWQSYGWAFAHAWLSWFYLLYHWVAY
jgi:hypothetical protein